MDIQSDIIGIIPMFYIVLQSTCSFKVWFSPRKATIMKPLFDFMNSKPKLVFILTTKSRQSLDFLQQYYLKVNILIFYGVILLCYFNTFLKSIVVNVA